MAWASRPATGSRHRVLAESPALHPKNFRPPLFLGLGPNQRGATPIYRYQSLAAPAKFHSGLCKAGTDSPAKAQSCPTTPIGALPRPIVVGWARRGRGARRHIRRPNSSLKPVRPGTRFRWGGTRWRGRHVECVTLLRLGGRDSHEKMVRAACSLIEHFRGARPEYAARNFPAGL